MCSHSPRRRATIAFLLVPPLLELEESAASDSEVSAELEPELLPRRWWRGSSACARVLGRVWDQERESTQDAVADAVVGPGSYDVVPAVGALQRESYRRNAGAASFSGHVVVQD